MTVTSIPVAPALRRSFPTLTRLGGPVRWVFKSRRRFSIAVCSLLALVASPPLWWILQLAGLPDVGDPFAVGEFRSTTIPDDRNAFVLYNQAAKILKRHAEYVAKSPAAVNLLARWPATTPELRRWLNDNRHAIDLYLQGAERPDAWDPNVGVDRGPLQTFSALWTFRVLVLLEASRLEDQGDMRGAWNLYRASIRTIHHVGMRGDAYRRNFIQRQHRELHNRIMTWADDQRTTSTMLRRAIDDVAACEQLAYSERDSLKVGYIEVMALFDSPKNPGRDVPLMRFRRFWNPEYQLTPEQIQTLWDGWRFVRHEPERSRRVIRLLTANWLAYLNQPENARPKPDPKVASLDLYHFGPEAPAAARAVSPESLDGWFDTAYDAQQALLYLYNSGNQTIERANDADFLILLATELYHRDYGVDPPSYDVLVGPYLKSLPGETLAKKPPSQSLSTRGHITGLIDG